MSGRLPRVSVCMPAFNAERTIREAVLSVLGQEAVPLEVLVCDDGSRDGTLALVEAMAQADSRIRVFKNEANRGISRTRNRLVREARGEYIAWLDADDLALPGRLAAQMGFLDAHPEVVLVGGGIEFFADSDGQIIERRSYSGDDASLRRQIFRFSPVSQGAAMARRQALVEAGGFDEGLTQAEDLDLSFRLGRTGQFANLPQMVLRCRVHAGSVSHGRMRENIRCTLRVRAKAVREYGYRMRMPDRLALVATRLALVLPTGLVRRVFVALRRMLSGGRRG